MLAEAEILEICDQLGECPDQGSWYRVDLHVHSPASHDFAQEVKPPAERSRLKAMDVAEFVQALAAQGLDVVAITDHNTGDFVDKAVDAAKELARRGGPRLTVLAGVELTVNPGVHILAVLPDGGTDAVHHLLSTLGLQPEQRGREETIIEKAVSEVAQAVHDLGGIVIGAHCGSSKGVVEAMKGQARIRAIEALDLLEVGTNSTGSSAAKTEKFVRDDLRIAASFVVGSDSHDPRSLPEAIWVKMAQPSFNGLRQVLFEPALRIRRSPPSEVGHPRILGMAVTGGLYGAERLLFSPNLNVLIGGRGAGKSAVIDLLRFVFHHEPGRDDELRLLQERQSGFLAGVGEVVVHASDISGSRFAIVRSGAFELDSKKRIRFQEKARVFEVAGAGLIPRQLGPGDVVPVEFYGQGEVSKLAERADEQLRLIDDNIPDASAIPAEFGLIEKAEQIEAELSKSEGEMDALSALIAERPKLAADLKDLSDRLKDPIFERRALWSAEQQYFERAEAWLGQVEAGTKASVPSMPATPGGSEKWPSIAEVSELVVAMQDLSTVARAKSDEMAKAIQDTRTNVATMKAAWETKYNAAESAYREKLRELGASTHAKAAEEQRNLQARLSKLDEEHIPRRQQLETSTSAHKQEWLNVLQELHDVRATRNVERQNVVARLNQELAPRVRIVLDESGDRDGYADFVCGWLEGSGMMHREEQIAAACNKLAPDQLADAITASDLGSLMTAGLTNANAGRVLTYFSLSAIRQLRRFEVLPLVKVQLRREGEMTYTDLRGLSVGERCSAVLAIALLNKRRPLVVDQPEDDLDHSFVTESVVESLRAAKDSRQILAASHNPNIPVLGDAEMVIRVERLAGKDACRIKAHGGLELPIVTEQVQMLEGGPEAFERRRRRYAK